MTRPAVATPAAPAAPPAEPIPARAIPAASPVDPPLSTPLAAPELISSIHGTSIALVTATEDGFAAVTADRNGGVRLWPTLDGTREPVVLPVARPAALAIERDHGELVIGDLDPVGALELVRTSATGAVIARTPVVSERPYTLVCLVSQGVLALRDDQLVDVLDLHGAHVSQLAVKPGEHVVTIVVRHDRALAIVGDNAHRSLRGRWIDGATLAYGATTAALPLDPAFAIALSPDHRSVAGVHAKARVATIIELASGHTRFPPTYDADRDTSLVSDETIPQATPIGFVDNKLVALAEQTSLMGWSETELGPFEQDSNDQIGEIGGPTAVVDHQLIAARDTQLGFVVRGKPTRFLGYRLPVATSLRRIAGHWFAGDPRSAAEWTELDDDLQVRRIMAPPELGGPYLTAVPLDETHGLAISGDSSGPRQLVRFTVGKPDVEFIHGGVGTTIEYEEGSHLVAVEGPGETLLFHVDPRTSVLGDPIGSTIGGTLYLVDPARAHGRIGVVLEDQPDRAHTNVIPIRGLCATCDDGLLVGRTHVVTLDDGDRRQVAAHELTNIANLAPLVRASPDGAHTVTFANDRLTLHDATGGVVWTIALPGIVDAAWSETGELVALANGLVRVDVATGALHERRCGWLFGFTFDASFQMASPVVCDAE